MDDLLREKDMKIASLERSRKRQDEEIIELRRLRQKNAAQEIEQKKELDLVRIELEHSRREKEAVENRMRSLHRDLKDMESEGSVRNYDSSVSTDSENVKSLQNKVSRYIRRVDILEQQTTRMKEENDESIRKLKEEIGEVMNDKAEMEKDFLDRLASLDAEKRTNEIKFEEQMEYKDSKIYNLEQSISNTDLTRSPGMRKRDQNVINELSELKIAKKKLQDELEVERNEYDDTVSRLEETNNDLEQQIESMTIDLDIMRDGVSAETVQILDTLTSDRQEILENLERVAIIWDKADESIHGLENIMDELRPNDEDDIEGDSVRLLSTLETASLVHGQIKVALLLVELKMRNQLNALKNDRLQRSIEPLPDTILSRRMSEIQDETSAALEAVEYSLADQIQQLETFTREETANVRHDLMEKNEELRLMHANQRVLESELAELRAEDDSRRQDINGMNGSTSSSGISRSTLERLQSEILAVVDRIKKKNETIVELKSTIDELKVRESTYKRELKKWKKGADGGRSRRR